ncbi:MAG: TonB-dependent receptor [Tannerella sp.]|jgi:TonB-linked SusC/RagA family outer membrane protein|nr:TonB-dependent receptor [Tannerella sp.]
MTKVLYLIGTSKKSLCFIVFLIAFYGSILSISAQTSIRGIVVDIRDNEPVTGAAVLIKGGKTDAGAVTDIDGKFEINAPSLPVTIVVSYIGYRQEEIDVYEQPSEAIFILLQESFNVLNEVVVIGYGTQKKINLTGAISTLGDKALTNRPITNSTQALHGINGVYVNQVKGRPGADGATIRIRGVGTLNDNAPLTLVDGMEYPLDAVNPNDIESISVLKDAASAAIYGNRAANGVVLVKTKTGSLGKTQIDYNGYYGVQTATFYPNVVTNAIQYMEGKDLALKNEGKPAEYGEALIEEYRQGTDPYIYPNTDWFDIMYRTAPIQEHNLRVSGGSDKALYSISLGYLDQDGILLNTWAEKYTLNANISSELTRRLTISAGITGSFNNVRESAYTADEGNGEGGIMGLLYRGLPMQVPTLANGAYADQWVRVPGHNFFRNPYALSYEGFRKSNTLRNLVNLSAEYTFPFDIKYKITGAANFMNESEKYAYPQILLEHPKTHVLTPMGNIPSRGVRQYARTALNLTSFQTLNWDRNVGRHDMSALAGFSLESFDNGNFNAYNEGYLGNDLTELNAGSTAPAVAGTSSQSRLESFFGRFHYGYNDKYIVEANFRYDGSSRFAKGRRWGFFPSFSGAWRISQEAFLRNVEWINNMKIRVSWGKLGNQNISLFSYVNAISLGQNYSFNGTVAGGTAVTQIADPAITWESTGISDIGIDVDLFANRLSLEIDGFDKRTTDILRQVNVPSQVGNLTGPYRNIGSVSNRGLELTLNYRDRIGRLGYSFGGNVTRVKNKVLDIKENIYYSGVTIIREGYPIYSFFGKQAEGIFLTEEEIAQHAKQGSGAVLGDLKYRNIYDEDDIIDNNDRTVIGSSIPDYTYSFTVGADYKGWELTLFFQGVEGINTYVSGNLAFPYVNGAGVTPEWLTDSWTRERPDASLPRLTTSRGYPANFETSDFWLKDASYLRLKNAQLLWTLPDKYVKATGINKIKLFVNAQNYLTFTKFKLGDPERDVTRNGMIDYPIAKTISGGVNITF